MNKRPLRLLLITTASFIAIGSSKADKFTKEEQARGEPKQRHLFVGAGLNVSQLVLGSHPHGVGKLAANVLEYVQLPYTSVRSN